VIEFSSSLSKIFRIISLYINKHNFFVFFFDFIIGEFVVFNESFSYDKLFSKLLDILLLFSKLLDILLITFSKV